MHTSCRTVKQLFAFFAFSLLASNIAQAADTINNVAPAEVSSAGVQQYENHIDPVNSTEAVKVEKPAQIKPKSRLSTTIGINTFKDTTVPTQEVSQIDIPLGLTVETERTTFEINIPYIQRTAPSGKIASSEHHESKKSSATFAPVVNSSGLGDITSSLMLTMMNEKDAPLSLYAKGEIKLATADLASGLGTGQNDYSAELKVGKVIGELSTSASIGYAILGSPGNVKINDVKKSIYFNNIYFGSVTSSYKFTERLSAGVNLDLGQASEAGGSEQRDLSVGTEFKFSQNKSLHMQIMKSVTPSLSIWGASASVATEF